MNMNPNMRCCLSPWQHFLLFFRPKCTLLRLYSIYPVSNRIKNISLLNLHARILLSQERMCLMTIKDNYERSALLPDQCECLRHSVTVAGVRTLFRCPGHLSSVVLGKVTTVCTRVRHSLRLIELIAALKICICISYKLPSFVDKGFSGLQWKKRF